MAPAKDRLGEYQRKRSFGTTPEPEGRQGEAGAVAAGRFVVQEHDATNLHWDLRLEHDGVALSWALPRGIPQLPDRAANRLAVRTEDHPLEYLEFQGEIPEGQYGAGSMRIWDTGTYSAEKLRDDEVIATFEGERLQGRYVLFQTRGRNWMIHRMDPPLEPERQLIPEDLKPMLPVRGDLPEDGEEWGFEIAWGGLRTLLWCEPGHIRRSRSRGLDAETVSRFPELRRIARQLGSTEAVLDGEIVVMREGRPSAEALRKRKEAGSENTARTLSKRQPATLMLYDLLFHDGHLTTALRYERRRELLEDLELEGDAWQTPSWHRGDGRSLLEAARANGLAGLIAKRLESPYRPGRRSEDWVKVEA
ncbi:MAG TPA: DNA polymerase ligase N-terminal domain-containing protein [Solirubrobacterales bacterium]|nr:DNA polymerase ligase N-terminal domain-containing protein [Solirubrobacterales bacterium]